MESLLPVHDIFGSRALLLFGEPLQFTLAIYILSNVHYGSTSPFSPISTNPNPNPYLVYESLICQR